MPDCRPAMADCSSACATSLRQGQNDGNPVQSQRPSPDRQRRRDHPRHGGGPQLWPHARGERRRRYQGLTEIAMSVDATMPTHAGLGARDQPRASNSSNIRLDGDDRNRGQFPDLPDAADHAACSTRTRWIRSTPTSSPRSSCNSPASSSSSKQNDQLKSLIEIEKERAGDPGAGLSSATRSPSTAARRNSTSPATWNFQAEKDTAATITITNSTGQAAYTGNLHAETGQRQFRVGRQGQ